MDTRIRPLAENDTQRACALIRDVFSFAYRSAYDDEQAFDTYLEASFAHRQCVDDLNKNRVECLVGEFNDEMAGLLKLADTTVPKEVPSRSAVELAKLYVLEEFHGTGIAGVLLEKSFIVAKEIGFDAIWLCVWENNPRAQAFYKKYGFESVGEVVIPMNRVPFRDVIMWRSLKGECGKKTF